MAVLRPRQAVLRPRKAVQGPRQAVRRPREAQQARRAGPKGVHVGIWSFGVPGRPEASWKNI